MSLAFLFKKGWHTATIRNQEKVWIAEQKHEEEEQRIRDLQKQVEEERQLQELQGVTTKREDRVDWMYEGAMQVRAETDAKEADEYLLGKTFKGKQVRAATALLGGLSEMHGNESKDRRALGDKV
ncbi:hypothetical protein JKP88DRAFT_175592 [Tribonema minus]|uniref:CBF1-interacting co-repressor CIR N-terminal domain-containing protein n=1 Tax=Tribonema minus TaxID=303371 RepID=A0A836CL59_9STRA|nr:hypothetical protein JKP88DRAFT_175592 [Tribonema minus]